MNRAILFLLIANLVLLLFHTVSHLSLSIYPPMAWSPFILIFFYLAPLYVLIRFLKRDFSNSILRFLWVVMVGSLSFATIHHFFIHNPDHIQEVPAGFYGSVFIISAYGLSFVESLLILMIPTRIRRENKSSNET